MSPDGSSIAYVANNQIYLRVLNEFEAHPIPGTFEGATPSTPFFSPDGQRFLMVLADTQPGSSSTSRPQINIVENWFEDLR